MDTNELLRKLKSRCGDAFLGVFACDRLPAVLPPRRPLLIVCNTDPHYKPGEHWIAMYIDKEGEYFDSYGRHAPPLLKRYMNKYCSSWTHNDVKLQSVISSFCGHYCVFYCLFKSLKYSMDSIVNCFSDDTTLNDAIVHKFVCKIIKSN